MQIDEKREIYMLLPNAGSNQTLVNSLGKKQYFFILFSNQKMLSFPQGVDQPLGATSVWEQHVFISFLSFLHHFPLFPLSFDTKKTNMMWKCWKNQKIWISTSEWYAKHPFAVWNMQQEFKKDTKFPKKWKITFVDSFLKHFFIVKL